MPLKSYAVYNISMAAPDQLPLSTFFKLVYCLQNAGFPSLYPMSTTPQHNTVRHETYVLSSS